MRLVATALAVATVAAVVRGGEQQATIVQLPGGAVTTVSLLLKGVFHMSLIWGPRRPSDRHMKHPSEASDEPFTMHAGVAASTKGQHSPGGTEEEDVQGCVWCACVCMDGLYY